MSSGEVVVLYSGGLESRYLLELARDAGLDPYCVLVSYGQKHVEELTTATKVCKRLGLNWEYIFVDWNVQSALTDGIGDYEDVSRWYVPSRNMLFVSLAAGIAESRGSFAVWIGASYTDRVDQFPDCGQEWVYAMNQALAQGTSQGIQLVAPLLGYPKALVKRLSDRKGITEEEVYSGYGNEAD